MFKNIVAPAFSGASRVACAKISVAQQIVSKFINLFLS